MDKITQIAPVSASPDFVRRETRSHKGGHPLSHKPAVYLPLAQTLRWDTEIPGGPLPPPSQPPRSASPRRGQTDPEHAPPESQCGTGRVLGKAAAAGLYVLHLRSVPFPVNLSGTVSENFPLLLKVERSHRKDNEEFYASHKFFSFLDFQKQLAVRQRQYNAFPIRPLAWRSPNQVLSNFVSHH